MNGLSVFLFSNPLFFNHLPINLVRLGNAMPVECPSPIPRLTSEQFGTLDYRVMPIAFDVHDQLGCHWKEHAYQSEMHVKVLERFDSSACEVPLRISFGNFRKTYRLDLIVDSIGLYELKAVAAIEKNHIGQVLNYLRLLDATRAKIINFRPHRVESKFVNCSDRLVQRRAFDVELGEYRGPKVLPETSIAMFRDLGTKLSNALYTECLISNVGRTEPRQIWRDRSIYQNFDLVEQDEAFVVTSLEATNFDFRIHLERMRRTAGLKMFHWINVSDRLVRLESVG